MRFLASLLLLAAALPARLPAQQASPLRFDISWPAAADGHVVLILSTNNRREPRFQISEGLDTQRMFGADVEDARTASIAGATLGYPLASLAEVPAGEYYVQAVLNRYETFHRSDGRLLGTAHVSRRGGLLPEGFDEHPNAH